MENEKLDIYTNTKYSFGREERKNIVLDIKEEITSTEETDIDISKQFNVTLDESVTIDTHSDVFLDSITTFNCKSNKTNDYACLCTGTVQCISIESLHESIYS